MSIDIQELAREIAFRLDPDALLDSVDAGVMLKCSARYVTERYALMPDFPKAIRLPAPGGVKGHPLWRRSAIAEWVKLQEAPKRSGKVRIN